MSTITVVRRGGEVAIAADSLSMGSHYKRMGGNYVVNHQKLFQIGENWLAIAGPSSAKQALRNYFGALEEEPILTSVADIYRTWLKLHQDLKDEYFLNPNEDADECFESTRMDVLIANPSGIFSIDGHRHATEFSKFYAVGSGDEFALGAMYVAYQDESKSAEEIACIGVEASIVFSSNSDAPVYSQAIQLKS